VIERPVQQPRPPIVVAAQGPRAIYVAARHADTWNSLGGQPIEGERISLDQAVALTRRQLQTLDDACVALRRDPRAIRLSVYAFRARALASVDAAADWIGRYRELGFTEFVLGWPQPIPAQEATLERFAGDLLQTLRRADTS
jgi:alkanesulfonate monooxygenase SsuD/methylene tetrahydromethanopterin reductase-like flavin-dependent oxidoreductase (luciferase family)